MKNRKVYEIRGRQLDWDSTWKISTDFYLSLILRQGLTQISGLKIGWDPNLAPVPTLSEISNKNEKFLTNFD